MPATRRPVLLKLSGEVLKGDGESACDPDEVDRVCAEIRDGARAGVGLAVVVGGGNILRGKSIAERSDDPTVGDYMGMLATLINSLALRDGLRRAGLRCEVVAPQALANVAHGYCRDQVLAWLSAGVVVVFGGGTGHPFFTTDTTAALRAAEIDAELLLKASTVDGVYDKDPNAHGDARRFERLGFDEAIAGRYAVMDQTAFALCRERGVPIRVFDMRHAGAIAAALGDDPPGTLIA